MAKTKSHEKEIQDGIESLRQGGIAVDELAAALVPPLKEQFGKHAQTDLAIIFLLGKIADSAAVDVLAAWEAEARDKALKKEIRRSLFKLSQKGLAVPEAKPGGGVAAVPSGAEIEGYMSAVDGSGGRLVWIVKVQPGQGLRTIQAMLTDKDGLLRIGGAQIRRRDMRGMFREIKEKHGISMVPVPWEYADAMIYDAYERARERGQSGLENFHQLRAPFDAARPRSQEHPIYRRLDAGAVRDGAWREQSRRLLEEPELRFWILDEEWVRPYLAQLEEAQTSRLVLNPAQKEERLAGIVRDAVRSLCTGEMAGFLQRRLEDMALYFAETGRESAATLSLAVAVQVGTGDPGPLDISFLTGLVQKSFGFYLSQQKAKQSEEPSFIVKP